MSSLKSVLKNFRSRITSWLLRDIQDTQAQTLQSLQELSNQLEDLSNRLPETLDKKYADRHQFKLAELAQTEQRRINKTLIRQYCQTVYVGDGVALCQVLGKYRLYVNAAEAGLAAHLMLNGFWEMCLTEFMIQTVQPGMTAIDIGANFGYFTILLADLCGSAGQVYAFEPNSQVNALLNKSIHANAYDRRVQLYQKAVTDQHNVELQFCISKDYSGHAMLVNPTFVPPSDQKRVETVSSISLDALLGNEVIVDFVKIDAEGSERQVWQGMQNILNRSQNICIAMEFGLRRHRGGASEFLDEMLAMGFQLAYLSDAGLNAVTKAELLVEAKSRQLMLILRRVENNASPCPN